MASSFNGEFALIVVTVRTVRPVLRVRVILYLRHGTVGS